MRIGMQTVLVVVVMRVRDASAVVQQVLMRLALQWQRRVLMQQRQ